MSRRPILLGCLILFVLLPMLLILFIPYIRQYELARRTETDFAAFRDSDRDELYCYYPELISRIAEDPESASRIEVVYLSNYQGEQEYSALLQLPRLRKIDIMYGHEMQNFVPTLNALPALEKADFAYCDPYDEWVAKIDNPTLRVLTLHAYQPSQIRDEVVAGAQANMPECTIQVTSD